MTDTDTAPDRYPPSLDAADDSPSAQELRGLLRDSPLGAGAVGGTNPAAVDLTPTAPTDPAPMVAINTRQLRAIGLDTSAPGVVYAYSLPPSTKVRQVERIACQWPSGASVGEALVVLASVNPSRITTLADLGSLTSTGYPVDAEGTTGSASVSPLAVIQCDPPAQLPADSVLVVVAVGTSAPVRVTVQTVEYPS